MHRHFRTVFLAFIAIGLVLASPAIAGDQALQEKVRQLEKKVDELSNQQSTQLERTIESYLDSSSAWKAADGEGLKNITITAAFTANAQATIDAEPNDTHAVSGDIDLGFHFKVTDNLSLHITGTAASGGSTASTVNTFPTGSGLTDGIGTNGNVSTTGTGRAFNIYEAYIVVATKIADKTLNWEIGAMDPRVRFLQNAFADDENTQFINNLFDDDPAIFWPTNATGAGVLGIHMWITLGENDAFTLNWGWFNSSGTFFSGGQFFFQISWTGKVDGRDMNARAMVQVDDTNVDAGGDPTIAFGLSWDWWVTDKIGIFVRAAGNDDDINPIELDASFGAEFHIIESRPNDSFGVAVGIIRVNDVVLIVPEDTEITVEVYYKIGQEDGKLQITPYIMFIQDPVGGGNPNDTLVILGLRIHVPF